MTTFIALAALLGTVAFIGWCVLNDGNVDGVTPAERRRQDEARKAQARRDAVVADYHRRRREA